MSTSFLLEMLRRSGLEHYYPSFSTRGITQLDHLAQLSMQDYNSLGVTSMEDRRRLFQLIQNIKAEYPDVSGGAASTQSPGTAPHAGNTTNGVSGGADGTGYAMSGMAGITRGYSGHSVTDMNASKPMDPRHSLGRRSGSTVTSTIASSPGGHARSMSNNIPFPNQQQQMQQQQQQQMQQQQQQQMQQQQIQQQQQQQMQQQQQHQHQQQQLQQQQQRQYEQQLYQQKQQELLIQQQQQQQYQQSFDGRNFKEASEDEEEAIPIHEAKQRGLDAYSVPTGMGRKTIAGRGIGGMTTAFIAPTDMTAKIRVCVRKRPLNSKEINKGEKDMATVAGRQLAVDEPKVRVDMTKFIERHNFVFDEVFDTEATNEDVYKRTAYPLVQYLFEGGKATCFAYGQTGSGKTFTMLDDKQGLYVLAARDIFVMLRKPEHSHLGAFIGFYEIYQGHLHDLLNNRKKLHPREDGKSNVIISGLKEYEIVNVQGLMQVFEYGNNVRSTGSTNANADSSRSHAIMQIVLKNRGTKSVEGKLSFIDLAGSERGADRGDTDVKTRMEGAEINKSLLALKECIRALDQDKKHTPFRQSKLTQVLKDSFVGNSRTCMVATISPNNSNSEHTLNTLRYADRVKELKAEGGAKGTAPGSESGLGQEEYMDDDDALDDAGLSSNVYDDDYMSSESENVADVTIDLLEDEEFPDILDQSEMSQELEGRNLPHPQTTVQQPQHQVHSQQQHSFSQQMPTGGSGARKTRGSVDHGEGSPPLTQHHSTSHRPHQQPTEPERHRESASLSKSSTSQLQQQHHAIKARKSESAFSRLPMPKSFQLQQQQQQQQQQSSSFGMSSSSSTTSIPSHRNSLTGGIGRNSTANTSPPLGSSKSSRADTKISPDTSMSPGNMSGNGGDYINHRSNSSGGSGQMMSPNASKQHPSINTNKHGYSSSVSSSNNNNSNNHSVNNNNGPASAGSNSEGGFFNQAGSPSSPKGSISSSSNNAGEWSMSDMKELVQEHRAQLRDGGELTKRETKLLANVSLGLSSSADISGYTRSKESFMKYLDELDEIMDKKLIAIVGMSDKIKSLREQMME